MIGERPTPFAPGAAEAPLPPEGVTRCGDAGRVGTPPAPRSRALRARKLAVIARPEACTACGACVESCPRGAVDVADVAVVDDTLCIGCAACVDACPNNVIEIETRSQ